MKCFIVPYKLCKSATHFFHCVICLPPAALIVIICMPLLLVANTADIESFGSPTAIMAKARHGVAYFQSTTISSSHPPSTYQLLLASLSLCFDRLPNRPSLRSFAIIHPDHLPSSDPFRHRSRLAEICAVWKPPGWEDWECRRDWYTYITMRPQHRAGIQTKNPDLSERITKTRQDKRRRKQIKETRGRKKKKMHRYVY